MNDSTLQADTRIIGQRSIQREALDALVKPSGPFAALMELILGNNASTNMKIAIGDVVDQGSERYERLFGHHGLGGEFGNGIGNVLMRVQERMESPRFDGDYAALAERVRNCWRDKRSKATEYTDRSENVEQAMRRISAEIRACVNESGADAEKQTHMYGLLDRYDAALDAIDAAVRTIESCGATRVHARDTSKER
ncbi:MAG: hypothetical protein C0436_04580 [Alphaproteobacteria bacterium]|nr:hypothetical protein [Alphaproteobacteria bacterium]